VIRLYILPIDHQGIYRGPMHLKWRFNPAGLDVQWGMIDYGHIDITLVLCPNISLADHTTLTGYADVLPFPENLDQPVADQAFKDSLEVLHIPTDWATPSTTYRQLLRCLGGLFIFGQRYSHIAHGPLFGNGVTLDTNFKSLSAAQQSAFNATALGMGAPSEVSGNPKLRTLAKMVGDLWGAKKFIMCGVEF